MLQTRYLRRQVVPTLLCSYSISGLLDAIGRKGLSKPLFLVGRGFYCHTVFLPIVTAWSAWVFGRLSLFPHAPSHGYTLRMLVHMNSPQSSKKRLALVRRCTGHRHYSYYVSCYICLCYFSKVLVNQVSCALAS